MMRIHRLVNDNFDNRQALFISSFMLLLLKLAPTHVADMRIFRAFLSFSYTVMYPTNLLNEKYAELCLHVAARLRPFPKIQIRRFRKRARLPDILQVESIERNIRIS